MLLCVSVLAAALSGSAGVGSPISRDLPSTVGTKKTVGENFIANGRFETEQCDVPAFWHMDSWNHPENLVVDPTGGPDGLPCVSARAPEAGKVTSFGMAQGGFRLAEKGRYLLSGWVRKQDFLPRKRSGLVFHDGPWIDDCGIDFTAGTCDWTRFEQEVHAVKTETGLLRLSLFIGEYSGSISLADVRLEAMDEETLRQTGKSALVAAQDAPKLIPWLPLLSEVPRENPRVTFRFFGELPDPGAYEAVLTVDGNTCDRKPLPARGGEVSLALPQGKSTGRFSIRIANAATGIPVFVRTHDFRTVETCADAPAGRRLNNMVVELHAGKVPADGAFRFGLRHGGWTYVAVKGADEVLLDGKRVIDSATPRLETFRELAAGCHVVSVVGGGTAELTVRRIPELFSYAPVNSPIKENPPCDWAFQERYVLPAVTTLNGGELPQDARARYRASGRLWLANLISRDLKDGQDLRHRLEKAGGMSAAAIFYDGVTCDEQGFTDVPTMARYAEGLWAYGDPNGKRAYTWVIGSPATEGVDHDLLSAAANGTGGRGRFLSEIYLVARPTEEKARAALNLAARDKIGVFRRYSPLVDQKYGVIFGAFNQAPGISLCAYPEVDYRYYLDMQFHLLANDPAFKDLSCTGVWGDYRADDELHRWTFMLMRHYFVEGRREMLSPSYGFCYIPGHLKNPDFTDGFSSWKTKGDVCLEAKAGFGLKTEGRWQSPSGVGDTYAVLSRKDDAEAVVEQLACGLQTGKRYVLRFAAFDADDIKADRFAPRRVGLGLVLDGAEVDDSLSWEHVDDHPGKGARINYRQVVFTARQSEVSVRFAAGEIESGRRIGLNDISLLPYLSRDDD